MMNMKTLAAALCCCILASCAGPKNGAYSFQILTTNDVHGTFFDSTYVGGNVKKSLMAVKRTVDSVRTAVGKENVILIDAGDILQGDNAAYYFNYVDTVTPHVYPRMAKYMGYDAVTVGNHDIETGHKVYDRVARDLESYGIPFLAGNAIRNDNGKPYFSVYTILKRQGVRIAILGFDNANISNWLSERLWSGMKFENLLPLVQQDVDKVVAKEKPDVVIVSVHSATGSGDGSQLESQGLDLMKTLRGVDFLICSHDHKPVVIPSDTLCLINAGSHCRYVGHGVISLTVEKRKVASKELSCELIPVDRYKIDPEMEKEFHDDYLAVKDFTTREVGELMVDLGTREAYTGMSHYLNLIHTLSISCSPAQVSFAAPLTFNGFVRKGKLIYNDLFTIYPFENQIYVVRMTGQEIKDYLEASYDRWINTVASPTEHILKIADRDDARTGQKSWSFIERAYNFDSAGGLVYTVDVTKPRGGRIDIQSMAGGQPFDTGKEYKVAMTSYRASGGGGLMKEAGIDTGKIEERIVETYPEFRDLLYNYLKDNVSIDPAVIGDPVRIGHWEFIPEEIVKPAMEKDMELLFPRRR